MKPKVHAVLCSSLFIAACHLGFPGADTGFRGNGDARIVEFMRGNHMSSEAGIAKYLRQQLEDGLQPEQVIDVRYLRQRGADCSAGTPAVCTFTAIAHTHFSGLSKENAGRASRIPGVRQPAIS